MKLIWILLLINSAVSIDYCPGYHQEKAVDACTSLPNSGCDNYYQFDYNPPNLATFPYLCTYGTGAWCKKGTISCIPSCYPKYGGPNGYTCYDFTPYGDGTCEDHYADNYGDRWCKWDYTNDYCYDGFLCHD